VNRPRKIAGLIPQGPAADKNGEQSAPLTPESREAYINRELSWLDFARRVMALAQDRTVPLLERVKFADRFLEHSRIYRFENGGNPEFYIGSADWMRRNFDSRMETVAPVTDAAIQGELERILDVYESDNASAWDMQPDGHYVRRRPASGQPRLEAQQRFIELAAKGLSGSGEDAGEPGALANL
jgi:polyphosphate kinase